MKEPHAGLPQVLGKVICGASPNLSVGTSEVKEQSKSNLRPHSCHICAYSSCIPESASQWSSVWAGCPPRAFPETRQTPRSSPAADKKEQRTIQKGLPHSIPSDLGQDMVPAFLRCWWMRESWFSPKKSENLAMNDRAALVARSPISTSSTLCLNIYREFTWTSSGSSSFKHTVDFKKPGTSPSHPHSGPGTLAAQR